MKKPPKNLNHLHDISIGRFIGESRREYIALLMLDRPDHYLASATMTSDEARAMANRLMEMARIVDLANGKNGGGIQ